MYCLCVFCQPTYLRGDFNKLPDFFVQTFKIAVDSWEFSIVLLYILWDDRPIFIISSSNEQLQQQLEYALLKADCHSWWISKMQSGREDTLEERYAITFCLKLGKNATETYWMLQTTFGASCMNRASVFEWHERFKEGRESVRDDKSCGRSKEVNSPELIGQTVRVGVTMLRFKGSPGRDPIGRGQHSSNRVSVISTRTMHQSTTPSLSQTIWPKYSSHPSYCPALALCEFWLFPKLRGCRYEIIEDMKEAWDEGHLHAQTRGLSWDLPEVVWTVLQVHCSQRRLIRRGQDSCMYYQ